MEIYGLLKLTLLDYPEKLACTVFTGGCNFRCPFCHNGELAEASERGEISEKDFFAFLEKRRGILDGVCISGGEPLLCGDVAEFAERVHSMGFSVKLDTNGYMPKRLREFVEGGFCDYIAMDIKNSLSKYAPTAGIREADTDRILESIEYIKDCGKEHEFRTTVVREFHTADDIRDITRLIEGENRYFLQPYKASDNVIQKGLHGFSDKELGELLDVAKEYVPSARIRG